jgi:hypothetical protein
MGIAEQQSTRMVSEGEKDAKIELARAERGALEELGAAMREDQIRQSDYMLAQRYNDLLLAATLLGSRSDCSKTIYLPYEAAGLGGLIGTLHKVYGPEGPRAGPARRVSAAQFDAAADAVTVLRESALD